MQSCINFLHVFLKLGSNFLNDVINSVSHVKINNTSMHIITYEESMLLHHHRHRKTVCSQPMLTQNYLNNSSNCQSASSHSLDDAAQDTASHYSSHAADMQCII